jgi:hypothetical protein
MNKFFTEIKLFIIYILMNSETALKSKKQQHLSEEDKDLKEEISKVMLT